MCLLADNIKNKAKDIATFIHSIDEVYEVLRADDAFRGAVVKYAIVTYFEGNEAKALEAIEANTGLVTQYLKKSLSANAKRLRDIASIEKQALAIAEANEALRLDKLKTDNEAELKRIEAKRLRGVAEAKKLKKAKENLAKVSERTINKVLGGTSSVERIEIMATIPKGATLAEIKETKTKLVTLNSITDEVKRNAIKELLTKYPTMQKWDSLEAVYASKLGGLRGNTAQAEVVALINPTTAEVADLRLSIIQAKNAKNEELSLTAERDDYGCRLPIEETTQYKEREEREKVEREKEAKRINEGRLEHLANKLPTEPLNIPKGKMKAKSRDEITELLTSFGLTEDNQLNYIKSMIKKLKL